MKISTDGPEQMFFTGCHSVILLIFAVAVVFAGITVSKLRNPPETYNARLFTFGYFSLSAWILWIFQYAIISVPFLPFLRGFSLNTVLWLGAIQNTLWASAVFALHFKQLSRKLLSLPVLVIFSVLIALVAYQRILTSEYLNDYVTAFDILSNLPTFIVLAISIVQLRLSKMSAAAFLIHGYSQWIWRWLWLTPSGTTWAVQLAFPLWRILLLIAWFRLISEMEQRAQPALQKFAQLSDQKLGNLREQPELPNLLVTLKVMISSTVEDLIPEREAADRAIRGLNLTRFRAETFGSVAHSPKVICALLAEQCDIFVLIIGERHGYIIESEGISVVDFEYRVARAQNPEKILVYVKDGVDRDAGLTEFLQRVQDFEHGYFRSSFTTTEDLHDKIQRDIVRWIASQARQNNRRE